MTRYLVSIAVLVTALSCCGCGSHNDFAAVNLTCDYAENPIGIDNPAPRLSWELQADGRSRSQSAYRIMVASSPELLSGGEGDIWDTGKVMSNRSIQVKYKGRPLRSGERCWWAVQVWDESGRQGIGMPVSAWWEMGLLEQDDWGDAGWITAPVSEYRYPYEDTTTESGLNDKVEPAPMFRTSYAISGEVRRARAYISGLGYYELRLNGEKVGDHLLDPALTPYDDRVHYVTYDITDIIRQGENVAGATLGNGFYNISIPAWGGYHSVEWKSRPALVCRIEVEYADGAKQTIVSDSAWKTTTGPILFDGVMNGETYDARLERTGWDAPGYDDSGWANAIPVEGPAGVLSAQTIPPVKVRNEVKPVHLTEPQPGVFVYDLGVNMAGWLRLRVSGPAGTKITLKYGERIFDDGMIDRAENARGVSGRFQTDEYILKGGGEEIWEPRFVYHGFQYVEVTGWPGTPTLESVIARSPSTSFADAGQFESSSELLNRIHEATRRSYVSNFMGNPTDCPQREKNGWTGDGHIAGETGLMNYRNALGYSKWIDDFEGEQLPNGQIPAQIPNGGGGYRIWDDYNHPEAGFGPAWNSSYVIVPWYLYLYCGDTRILERHWEGMTAWFEYVKDWSPGYVCEIGLGDWVAIDQETPIPLTSTGYYYIDAVLLSNIATVLGKPDDSTAYAALADSIKDAFNSRFYNSETGLYSTGSQTALSCALYQGLVPEAEVSRVAAALAENVIAEGGHLNVGLLGSKYLLTALTGNGYGELAYTVASQKDYPGWGWWIEQGATSLWEDWPGERSRNHIMFGEIDAWFYKTLGGINPDPADPGFHHIIIKPHPLGDLEWVNAVHVPLYGRIRSSWRRGNGRFTLDVEVPVNTTATVYVPADDAGSVTEGGVPADEAEGVDFLRMEDGAAVFTVGSGTYSFQAGQ